MIKKSLSKRLVPLLAAPLVLSVFSGFGSCSMGAQEICVTRFPEFERELEQASLQLSEGSSARAPASLGTAAAGPHPDPERWQRWAERRLKEAQQYIDNVEGVREQAQIRVELSNIATQLVTFHGYAGRQRTQQMVRSLEQIQARSTRVRALACKETP